MTDETLMLAVRNGDRAKLAVLFERHHRSLYEYFCRMTGSRSAGEDLVQDVFVRILKYCHTYHGENGFKNWLYTIARNSRATYFQNSAGETLLPEEEIVALSDRSVSSAFAYRDPDVDTLRKALLSLDEDQREILVLARYQGMKYDEIAQLLNITTGSVKVRVHRAMNQLRDAFMKLSGERKPWNVQKLGNTLRII